MIHIARALALLLLPFGAAADGSSRPQDPEIPLAPAATEPGVEGAMMIFDQVDKRLTVPVAVGGSGPYHFIIDTGAERTVVSRELAGTLGLAPGAPVTLTSMTGRSVVDTVIVPALKILSLDESHRIVAPALAGRNLGAPGLLGIDTLAGQQVSIDFDTGMMTVTPAERRSTRRRNSDDEIVVTARSQFGQLIVTDAYYGKTKIQVVLDTGSQVSMGNSALRRRIGKRIKEMHMIQLTSVTGGKATAEYTLVPDVKVGDIQFDWLPVAFADVAPFKRFGLTRKPALLLGMDALKSFHRVEIDFANRQVRFRMRNPGEAPPAI